MNRQGHIRKMSCDFWPFLPFCHAKWQQCGRSKGLVLVVGVIKICHHCHGCYSTFPTSVSHYNHNSPVHWRALVSFIVYKFTSHLTMQWQWWVWWQWPSTSPHHHQQMKKVFYFFLFDFHVTNNFFFLQLSGSLLLALLDPIHYIIFESHWENQLQPIVASLQAVFTFLKI